MLDLDVDSVEVGKRHEQRGATSGERGAKDRSIERLTGTIADIMVMTWWTRSRTYLNLAEGKISALKDGKRTLVTIESVRQYIASLPPAEFGPGRAAA